MFQTKLLQKVKVQGVIEKMFVDVNVFQKGFIKYIKQKLPELIFFENLNW